MVILKLSLVMATIGRVAEIGEFLASLAAQTYKNHELIIVDQNADDRLLPIMAMARELGISCLHIRQSEPNLCLARNTGLIHAQGDLVAFPDDDCWYEPDVLEKVVNKALASDNLDGLVIRWQEQGLLGTESHYLSNDLWRRFREVQASSITLFFTRQLLLEMKGFDVALGLHSWYGSGEETDFMFRALGSGKRILFIPDAIVHHPFQKLTRQPFFNAFRQSRKRARGTGALYAKHELDISIIARGFLAPGFHAIRNLPNTSVLGSELGKIIGRIEGCSRWFFSEKRAGKNHSINF